MIKTEREKSVIHPDWPEAIWHISGLYNNQNFLSIFINQMDTYKLTRAIGSLQACPDLAWVGGHVNMITPNTDLSKFFTAINQLHIGIFLTFTNLVLEKEDMSDREANQILEQIDEECGLNGVVIASDILSEYIRNKKPGLKQICSFEKALIENPKGEIDWYKKMQDQFDRVIVFPDHAFNLGLLDQLDRERTEILVNDECVYRCQARKRHLTAMSRFNIQRSPRIMEELKDIKQNLCSGEVGIISEKKNPAHVRSCFLSYQELKTIYNMGFRNFRICGQRKPLFGLAWDVTHFVYHPAFAYIFSAVFAHKTNENLKNEFKKITDEYLNFTPGE